ncbi:unnamed protein product, partial [Brassica oleracea]
LSSVHCCSTSPVFGTRKTSRSMLNSWEPLYSGIKSDFKVFTEIGPKTSLITDGTRQSKRTSLISF